MVEGILLVEKTFGEFGHLLNESGIEKFEDSLTAVFLVQSPIASPTVSSLTV
jgi:hypothetical protein